MLKGDKGVKGSYRLFEPKEIKADSSDYALRLHPLNIWPLTPCPKDERSDNSFTPLSQKKAVSSCQRALPKHLFRFDNAKEGNSPDTPFMWNYVK